MTPEELDRATADEAWRLLEEGQDVAVIAARMAREQEQERAKVLVEPVEAIVNRAKPLKPTGVLRREIIEDPADWDRDYYAENAKPPEPEMTKPEPDWIAIRLECLKLAVAQTIQFGLSEKKGHGYLAIEELSDEYLHYVLNGSVDKA